MQAANSNLQKVVKWSSIFGFWTIVAVFYTFQMLYQNANAGRYVPWQFFLKIRLIYCYLWFALTPIILWFANHFPLEHGKKVKNLAIHLSACILLAFTHLAFYTLSFSFASEVQGPPFLKRYQDFLISDFTFGFLTYWLIICVTYAMTYYRAYRERALRASQLEASLAQSQLQVLNMQLQPHFLFNTLNTIAELVHEDSESADKMIWHLSKLLRGSLENIEVQEVTLEEELDFLQKYLDIEQMRFAERLTVQTEIMPETLTAFVPNLIMQPLVENAVRHSILPRVEGGCIRIRTERKDAKLLISIEDDGDISPQNGPPNFKEGIGLSNTRARLEALYGELQHFYLNWSASGGLAIKIEIPFRTTATASVTEGIK